MPVKDRAKLGLSPASDIDNRSKLCSGTEPPTSYSNASGVLQAFVTK